MLKPVLARIGAPMTGNFIVVWSGAIASLPSGWRLCNGTNDTPDLRDHFARGADYYPGDTEGAVTANLRHSHSGSAFDIAAEGAPRHTHTIAEKVQYTGSVGDTGDSGASTTGIDEAHNHTISPGDSEESGQASSHDHTGVGSQIQGNTNDYTENNVNILPWYYALAYCATGQEPPVGGIIGWNGAVADIPAGYLLCNGTGGTPDLRDLFVVGAGDSYALNDTGGSEQYVVPQHTHDITAMGFGSGAHDHTGSLVTSSGAGLSSIANNGITAVMATPNHNHGYDVEPIHASPDGGHSHGVTNMDASGNVGFIATLPSYYDLLWLKRAS